MLIIIRTMYYIVKHFNLQYYKTIVDVTSVIVLYFTGKRMYTLLNTPSATLNLIKIPTNIELKNM